MDSIIGKIRPYVGQDLLNASRKQPGSLDGYKFDYVVCEQDDFEWVELYFLYTDLEKIVFPTSYLGKPVLFISLHGLMEKRAKPIKEIVVGGSILNVTRITKLLTNLEKITIADNASLPLDSVLFYLRLSQYSKNVIKYELPKSLGLIVKDKCLLSNDEKELYSWLGKNEDVVIPQSVEIMHESSLPKTVRITDKIVWPKKLRVVEDRAFVMSALDFYKHHQFPKTVEFAGDCCFLSAYDYYKNAFVYVTKDKLYIADNIKDLSEGLVAKIIANSVAPCKNFSYKDGLLLSKDGTVLYKAISKLNAEKEIVIPASIKRVYRSAFKLKSNLRSVVVNDPDLVKDCIYDERVKGKVKIVSEKTKEKKKPSIKNTASESKQSLMDFYKFLEKNELDLMFVDSLKYEFLLKKEDGSDYRDFDELMSVISKKIKPIKLNLTNVRGELNSPKLVKDIPLSYEFMQCFNPHSYLGDFAIFMLTENGVLPKEDEEDTIEYSAYVKEFDKALRDYVNSEDFEGVANDPSSNIYIIHHEEMGEAALAIFDMSNLPSKFFSKDLVYKTIKNNYFIAIISYY